jgi:hypothetical protein
MPSERLGEHHLDHSAMVATIVEPCRCRLRTTL